MQQAVVCHDLKFLYSFLLELRQHIFVATFFLSFSMITLLRQCFLCRENILLIPQKFMSQGRYPCCSIVSVQLLQVDVATSFSCCDSAAELLLQIGVVTQIFLSRQHLCYGYCCNTVLYYFHLGHDPKKLSL